jgi:hypothetical protein
MAKVNQSDLNQQARIKALEKENQALKKANKEGKFAIGIEGVYKSVNGKTYKFKDGSKYTRLANGVPVLTEELIKLATDEKYRPSADVIAENPSVAGVNHKKALARLEYLVQMGYGQLQVVK